MDAKIKGVWLIAECPYCNAPQTINKWVKDNSVLNLLKARYQECTACGEGIFITLKEMDVELQ
jgi:Zn ribbon nucleic-acid-binding protein